MSIKWNANLMIPTDSNYKNRVTNAQYVPSNAGNPQLVLECEIVEPAEVEIDGKMVTIAGVKTKNYFGTKSINKATSEVDEDKTEAARARFTEFWQKAELDPEALKWEENIDVKPLIGKVFFTLMSANIDEQRKNPTSEQLAKDKNAKGPVMTDPITGKKLVKFWPQIDEFFGLVPV